MAVQALSALAHESRLAIFRALVVAGPNGLPAGEIAQQLGLTPSSLSFHLKDLSHVDLIKARQNGRFIFYTANFAAMNGLLGFLTENCCDGNPCSPRALQLASSSVTIYHNPACGTSRNTLALIRNAGIEPEIIEYVSTPPSRKRLKELIAQAGLTVRSALREKGTPFAELGLEDEALSDEQLLNAMLAHPILINRPFVATPLGVKLCRPSELVLDILPATQQGTFSKEDGEIVIDAQGRRVK